MTVGPYLVSLMLFFISAAATDRFKHRLEIKLDIKATPFQLIPSVTVC